MPCRPRLGDIACAGMQADVASRFEPVHPCQRVQFAVIVVVERELEFFSLGRNAEQFEKTEQAANLVASIRVWEEVDGGGRGFPLRMKAGRTLRAESCNDCIRLRAAGVLLHREIVVPGPHVGKKTGKAATS